MKKIILASTSPRRREIMSLSGLDFITASPDCDENIDTKDPKEFVSELSGRKVLAICASEQNAVVIGADTVVCTDHEILGKPVDEKDAVRMLKELSGRDHYVYTGVTVIDTETRRTETFYEITEVTFYDLTEEEIQGYVRTKEPLDKAGAYGIQGKGAFLVRKINGDYLNVVGLPLARLLRVLRTFL